MECQPAHGRPRPDPHSRGAPGQFGEALFDQLFGDRRLYGRYQTALQAGVANLTFEIAGSPTFQRLHWEALKDPDLPQPFALQAPFIRRNLSPRALEADDRAAAVGAGA